MIGIINVGIGNVSSIKNWINNCNVSWEIINDDSCLKHYSLIILPGVGSAELFISKLKEKGILQQLIKANERGQRILGICLGAQIFFDFLEEGNNKGLGFIKGRVTVIPSKNSNTGWEKFDFDLKNVSEIWLKNKCNNSSKKKISGRVFYNHNYCIELIESISYSQNFKNNELKKFKAVVNKENLMGFQFHPEKSQELGLDIFKMIY